MENQSLGRFIQAGLVCVAIGGAITSVTLFLPPSLIEESSVAHRDPASLADPQIADQEKTKVADNSDINDPLRSDTAYLPCKNVPPKNLVSSVYQLQLEVSPCNPKTNEIKISNQANGREAIVFHAQNRFFTELIQLESGENTINISEMDQSGATLISRKLTVVRVGKPSLNHVDTSQSQ